MSALDVLVAFSYAGLVFAAGACLLSDSISPVFGILAGLALIGLARWDARRRR
jgi:hypothetical protein